MADRAPTVSRATTFIGGGNMGQALAGGLLARGAAASEIRIVEPLLAHHDPHRVEVVCFDVSRYADDAVTRRLKTFGHIWRRVGDLNDDSLAETIRMERIDILVDLSGHTEMNRLLTFARKPAPVQATWLGYLGTTGLTSMDYRITDAYLDPPGQTERASESKNQPEAGHQHPAAQDQS